MSEK
jgi:hypothetical protein